MAVKRGVEVVRSDLTLHPQCIHGPALLFDSGESRFYACASCRDKECTFHMPETKWNSENARESNKKYRDLIERVDHSEVFKKITEKHRSYCFNCNVLLKDKRKHGSHQLKCDLTVDMLKHPSTWLPPLSNDTKEAQYFFNEESVSVIIKTMENNDISSVICLGAPRIHEQLQASKPEISTFLLDIDNRYYNFYPPDKFSHYNMFNDFFFNGKEAECAFEEHLNVTASKKCCIVMDPPFGGRTEPLAQTLKLLSQRVINAKNSQTKLVNEIIPTIWVFPYFSESYIRNELQECEMSDYQVRYENHKKFASSASPVRIFTNLQISSMDLSNLDGYKYCRDCGRWVGSWNAHCLKCGICSGKKGSAYSHCDKCRRCVKPNFAHCAACERCALLAHKCGLTLPQKRCFNCGTYGHKKVDCTRSSNNSKRKNKLGSQGK